MTRHVNAQLTKRVSAESGLSKLGRPFFVEIGVVKTKELGHVRDDVRVVCDR